MIYAMVLKNVVIDIKEGETEPYYPPDIDGNPVFAVETTEETEVGMYYHEETGKFNFTNLNKLETVEQIFDINGEFTIDFWFSQREKKANATFIGGTQTGTFKIILSNGVPVFQVHGQSNFYSSEVNTQLNRWYHFALTGKNKTFSLFIDGTKKNTFTYTGNISNDILRIGLNVAQNSTGSIEGVMDEIRISNVVRWDSDFTPPTEPYTVYKNAQAGEIYVKESGTWKKILTGMK